MQRWWLALFFLLLTACSSSPIPPYVVLLTPVLPVEIGQCTGIIIAPREVLTPLHCAATAKRVVTTTGQEAWVGSIRTSQDHDLAVLTTDRVLWVSEFAQFARPEFGKEATLYGFCPYMMGHIARFAFYSGLIEQEVQGWPTYDYGLWIVSNGKICGGDSGSPVIQDGKVVGIVSLASTRIYAGKIAYAVPVEYVIDLLEASHGEISIQTAH